MVKKMSKHAFMALIIILSMAQATFAGFIIDHTSTDLSQIPDQWINAARTDLQIAYNHTSHGSQIITGMNALKNFPAYAGKYQWSSTENESATELCLRDRAISGWPDLSQGDVDNDGNGYSDWADDTYAYLTATDTSGNYVHDTINVVLWSWCNIAGHNIDRYLASMEWLIGLFGPGGSHARATELPVQFVFMTAHANGGGEFDSSDTPNRQIRQHCIDNSRILFDFSDIENYSPDNDYFLDKLLNDTLDYDSNDDGVRDANWASEYLAAYPGGELDQLTHGEGIDDYSGCSICSHSEGGDLDARLNCVLKGRAAWTLFARLAGWGASTDPPAAPDGLALEADHQTREISLSWQDNSDNENGFYIWRKSASQTWAEVSAPIAQVAYNSSSYTDTGLIPGDWVYFVQAFNAYGTADSADQTITLLAIPDAPSDLSATADSQARQILLTWQDNSDNENGFIIEVRTGETWEEIITTAPDTTSYLHEALSDGTYTYRVSASAGGIGQSLPSEPTTAVISNTVPASPSGLTAQLNGADVQLSWQDNSDNESQFTLYQAVDQEAFEPTAVLNANVTTHTLQNLSPYHDYTYRITADNSVGSSAPSNTASVYVASETFTLRLQVPDTEVTDTFLQSGSPDTNYGSTQYLSNFDRFIIRFNLPDYLTGKKILSARLGIYVWNVPVGSPAIGQTFHLYRVGQDWAESSATWNIAASDGLGGSTDWSTPGGNPQEVVADLPFTNADNIYDHRYLDEAELATIVQAWADGQVANYGLLLDANGYSFGIKASEYSSGRPYLDITYTQKPDCIVDFDGDSDIDGEDIRNFISSYSQDCLESLAARFGESGQ